MSSLPKRPESDMTISSDSDIRMIVEPAEDETLPVMVFSSDDATAIAERVQNRLIKLGVSHEKARQYAEGLAHRLALPVGW